LSRLCSKEKKSRDQEGRGRARSPPGKNEKDKVQGKSAPLLPKKRKKGGEGGKRRRGCFILFEGGARGDSGKRKGKDRAMIVFLNRKGGKRGEPCPLRGAKAAEKKSASKKKKKSRGEPRREKR